MQTTDHVLYELYMSSFAFEMYVVFHDNLWPLFHLIVSTL